MQLENIRYTFDRDNGIRDIGFRENDISGYGDSEFGILDFGKMDVSGKYPAQEKVYSGKLTSGNGQTG